MKINLIRKKTQNKKKKFTFKPGSSRSPFMWTNMPTRDLQKTMMDMAKISEKK